MWRIQGFFGRVLSRCHGNAPLRLPNSHHVEDEVINSSTVLSTSRQVSDSSSPNGSQGGRDEERKRRKTSQFCYARLPRYTALDAIGWGAAAVLFMQLCRRIHSQFTLGEQNAAPARLREPDHVGICTYGVLLDILSRRSVLPTGVRVMWLKGAPASPEQADSRGSSSSGVPNSSSSTSSEATMDLQPGHTTSHQQGETFSQSPTEEPVPDIPVWLTDDVPDVQMPRPASTGYENSQEKSLCSPDEAAQNLRNAADSSVPIILNIIGLQSAKAGDYKVAFECFLASAQHCYSKGQFNVGVCYESARGVHKDIGKALQYYRWAAAAGHTQAQYRCAKLLLDRRGQQSTSDADTSTALSLLHQAAAAGLTEAQLYLGVLLSQGDEVEAERSVQYFRMAAESGDSDGLLFLAQCYERGFGVEQSYSTAVGLYQQAAAKGNQQAMNTLRDFHSKEVLRSIRSAPCLSILDHLQLRTMLPQGFREAGPDTKYQRDWPFQPLLHSYSTGNLVAPPPFSAQTLHPNSRSGWITGLG